MERYINLSFLFLPLNFKKNKMFRLLILLIPLLLSSCGNDDDINRSIDSSRERLIDSKINNVMNQKHYPGISAAIVKEGEIVWMKSYGFANTTSQTPFTNTTPLMLASVSKLFTGTAVMQLVESGLIDIDDDINDYLPFEIHNPNFKDQPISFRMILTHTSSISDSEAMENFYSIGDPTITLAESIESYFSEKGKYYNEDENFNNNMPGSTFKYSNMATALNGYLVELISGIPFNEYCNQNIFDKLCMNDTRWFLSEYDDISTIASPHDYSDKQYEPIAHYGFADYPDGMLHSSVTDLANYMIAILQKGSLGDNSILSEASVNEMLTPQIPSIEPSQGLQFDNITFGTTSLWGHNGAEQGISTSLYLDIENNMGIVVLKNRLNEANINDTPILDILYDYGLTLKEKGIGNPKCTP